MERPEFGVLYSRFFPVILPGEFASTAQALGFDSVWVSDGPSSRRAALDPVVCMASMAHCADRIRIGSSVILVPIRNPAILAKEIASLDVVSGGRIVFGIGVGVSGMSDRGAYRATSTDPRERGARCDEYLEVMTTLWTGSADRYRGRFFEFDDIEMSPRPVQRPHPPIWAGGDAHGMLRRTARACQGFVPVATGPERYAERMRTRVRLDWTRCEPQFSPIRGRALPSIDGSYAGTKCQVGADLRMLDRSRLRRHRLGRQPSTRDRRQIP